ncbi:MAG: hypothetical protein K9M07_04810 [Simkaniaceae bacterium]|nr:hypothetical protein [Simkaniaceae bacterium]
MACAASVPTPLPLPFCDYVAYRTESTMGNPPFYPIDTEESLERLITLLNLSESEVSSLLTTFKTDRIFIQKVLLTKEMGRHAVLTDRGMQLIASHYREKYNYPIEVAYPRNILSKIDAMRKAHPFFGLIITQPRLSHVIPIFCHQSEKDHKLYILFLDSLGSFSHETSNELRVFFTKNTPTDSVLLFTDKPRQASRYGCQQDALVTLKYTMRHCTDTKPSHMPDILDITKREDSSIFKTPSCWVPGAQIFRDLDGRFDGVVINKRSETVLDLRKRYTTTIEQLWKMEFDKGKCEIESRTVTRSVCSFLHRKALAYRKYILDRYFPPAEG